MKLKIFSAYVSAVCFLALTGTAQPIITLPVNVSAFGGNDADRLTRPTLSGGVCLIGSSNSANSDLPGNNGQADAWIFIPNTSGNLSLNFGGSFDENFNDVCLEAGRTIAVGSSTSTMTGCTPAGKDILIVEFDNQLVNVVQQKCVGGNGADDGARLLYYQPQSEYILLANTQSTNIPNLTNHGQSDVALFKLDASLNVINTYAFGTTGFDIVTDAFIRNNTLVFSFETDGPANGDLTGTTPFGLDDIGLAEFDLTNWTPTNIFRYGGDGADHINQIIGCPGGEIYGFGSTTSSNYGNCNGMSGSNALALAFDDQFAEDWVKCIGGSGADQLLSGTDTWQSNCAGVAPLFAAGHTASNDGDFLSQTHQGSIDAFVVALDKNNGDILDLQKFGGSGVDLNTGIITLAGNQLMTINQTNSTDGDVTGAKGAFDAWMVTFGVTVDVDGLSINPADLRLHPNPTTGDLTLDYPGKLPARFSITDLTGKQVLEGSVTSARTKLATGSLAPGVYCFRLLSGQMPVSRKIVVY